MKSGKRKKLEKAGWRIGSAADFLALAPAEEHLVEIRLALGVTPRLTKYTDYVWNSNYHVP